MNSVFLMIAAFWVGFLLADAGYDGPPLATLAAQVIDACQEPR